MDEARETALRLCGTADELLVWTFSSLPAAGSNRFSTRLRALPADRLAPAEDSTVCRAHQHADVATRFDKRAYVFHGTVTVTAIGLWLRS
ncbi:hypothetical protein GCM10010260_82530 [Streptomyces filipinensis]|uniref:Transposase n=1 Tax=Streptomyces filipinensis TaxID=66887 RepID=A0A918IL04_9ACTN|nr:hypothetical protein GCM10010260_82530 [Streptomyces filipinensis]